MLRHLACLAAGEPQVGWPHWCHLPRLGTSVMAAAAIRHGCLLRLMMSSLRPAGARLPRPAIPLRRPHSRTWRPGEVTCWPG